MSGDAAPHPDPDALADLVSGEPTDRVVAAHVRSCPACAADLGVLREVADLVSAGPPVLEPPPDTVWAAIQAELDGAVPLRPAASPAGAERRPALSALSGRPAHPVSRTRAGSARVSAWWLLGAAAVGVLLGGAGTALLGDDAPAPAAPTVVARASLDTLDTGRVLGSADAVEVEGQLDLDVTTEPLDAGGGYLEVWLINRDDTRMVSIGVLRPGEGSQRFPIDERLIDQGYVVVDISREGFDDKPEHSGDSLVRGTLAPGAA